MALITWTKEQFGTNVSTHDQEHQTIFQMLNDLHDTVAGGGDRAAVGAKLDGLIGFVAKHFQSEETNMQKFDYPSYTAHKKEHDDLVAVCLDVQKKFHAGQVELTGDTTAFVKDWLVRHIPNVDKGYGPFLNSKGVN
jgi:hemerythrin